jgi:CheY-like chemotaxis protein/anti-sigma regulatory factor (Ser/Thr protein kinase)
MRIKQIISDVKNFAGKEEGNVKESVDVNQVIQDAVRLTRKLITDTTDHFSVDLAENLPCIRGNRQAIEQVIVNLIQNACQAIEERHQALSITSAFLEDNNTLQIEVKDQGKGISRENRNRIMDPFFTTRRETGGTGLGLSTSLNTVRNHGGTIKMDSREGEGSGFRIVLPLSSSISPVNVLIADDDPASRKIIRLILDKTGRFDFREAESGADALIQMGQDPPDLLILDIHMPDIDGYEVCRILRNNTELSRVQIIVITGLVNTVKTEKILALEYENILEKPVNRDELLKTVYSVLEDSL